MYHKHITHKMERNEIINTNLRNHFDLMAKKHIAGPERGSHIAINIGNSKAHEMKKAEVCYDLLRIGATIITEGKLINGKRPDILRLDLITPVAYEIVKSETQKSIDAKKISYAGIDIVEVRV